MRTFRRRLAASAMLVPLAVLPTVLSATPAEAAVKTIDVRVVNHLPQTIHVARTEFSFGHGQQRVEGEDLQPGDNWERRINDTVLDGEIDVPNRHGVEMGFANAWWTAAESRIDAIQNYLDEYEAVDIIRSGTKFTIQRYPDTAGEKRFVVTVASAPGRPDTTHDTRSPYKF